MSDDETQFPSSNMPPLGHEEIRPEAADQQSPSDVLDGAASAPVQSNPEANDSDYPMPDTDATEQANRDRLAAETSAILDEMEAGTSQSGEDSNSEESMDEEEADGLVIPEGVKPVYYVLLQGADEEQVERAINTRVKMIGGQRAMTNQILDNPGGYDDVLISLGNQSREALAAQTRIKNIQDAGGTILHTLRDADGKVILGPLTPAKPKEPAERKLSGEEALIAFRRASGKGAARRIPLYASGFYIDLVGPSDASLNNFYEQATQQADELGRMFGAVFYTHIDHYIKEAAFRLFRPLITGATLHNWDRGENLAQAICIEDYDTILMAVAALMFPNGYSDFRFDCLNAAECNHVISADVDLTKMIHHNFSKLNKEAIAHMRRAMKTPVTASELVTYRQLLTFTEPDPADDNAVPNEIRWQKFGFVLQSPSFLTYIAAGGRYLDRVLDGINRRDATSVLRAVEYRLLRQLAPWIAEIRWYEGEGAEESCVLRNSEPAVIEEILDDVQTADLKNEAYTAIADAIDRHKITLVGFPIFECPKCKTLPKIPSGYFTIEPLEAFFTMCMSKLEARG